MNTIATQAPMTRTADTLAVISSPEHRARATTIDSAADVHNHLTGLAASLRFIIAEMDGPAADALRDPAVSAEAAAQQAQGPRSATMAVHGQQRPAATDLSPATDDAPPSSPRQIGGGFGFLGGSSF